MAKDPQSRLAEILGQEYRSKGAISGLASALGKRAKEKFDPRNILFGGTGIGSKFGQKMFGKGYSATPEKVARPEKQTSAISEELITKLEKLETDLEIVAKKSISIPVMARDINIMKQNIAKMTNVMTKGKAVKRSETGFRGKISEKQYGKEASKISESKTPTPAGAEGKPAEKGEDGGVLENIFGKMFSSIGEGLGGIFSPKNLMMALKLGLKSFPVLALAASIFNGVWEAWKEYKETGDLSKAALKYLSGITFGLLSPDFFQENVITPIVDFIEKVVGMVDQYVIDPIAKTFTKMKDFFGRMLDSVIKVVAEIGIPRYEKEITVYGKSLGKIGIGPYYPFKGVTGEQEAPTAPAASAAPASAAPASAPAASAPAPAAPAAGGSSGGATPSAPSTPPPLPTTQSPSAGGSSAPTPAPSRPSAGGAATSPTPSTQAGSTDTDASTAATPATSGEKPKNVSFESGKVDISKVDPELLKKFYLAAAEYGKPVRINSAYRGDEYQAQLWVRGNILKEPGIFMPANPQFAQTITYKGVSYDVPGSGRGSSHGFGQAMDISPGIGSDFQPILEKYGITFPFPKDPPHIQLARASGFKAQSLPPSSSASSTPSQVPPAPTTGTTVSNTSTAVEDGQRRQTMPGGGTSNVNVASNTTNVKKSDTIRRDEFHDTTLMTNMYGA